MTKAASRRKWQFAALFMCRENICFRGQFFLLPAPPKSGGFGVDSVQEIGMTFMWTMIILRSLHTQLDRRVGSLVIHRAFP